MKYKKIVLAGGSGYLGRILADHFSKLADEVIILARTPLDNRANIKGILWDGKNPGSWTSVLEDTDLLVNLCGKNVNCRYTEKNRNEILQSRLIPTQLLGKVIASLSRPPRLWINVTSSTIYRHAEDQPQDEHHGEMGEGFSVEVCKAWEKIFFEQHTPHTRKIALRMGIVLGWSDGAFPRLFNLVRFGMGGKQGNGNQYINWIHEQDAINIVEWLTNHDEISGIINATAPVAVTNRILMQIIRKVYGMPLGLPTPVWLLSLGARIIGTETELILKSRWVKPAVLLENGFRFQYENADDAIREILKPKS